MNPFHQRIDRLQQHIHSVELTATAELLTEAKILLRREMEIGKDAALQELADSAGISVDQLLAETEELGRAA